MYTRNSALDHLINITNIKIALLLVCDRKHAYNQFAAHIDTVHHKPIRALNKKVCSLEPSLVWSPWRIDFRSRVRESENDKHRSRIYKFPIDCLLSQVCAYKSEREREHIYIYTIRARCVHCRTATLTLARATGRRGLVKNFPHSIDAVYIYICKYIYALLARG